MPGKIMKPEIRYWTVELAGIWQKLLWNILGCNPRCPVSTATDDPLWLSGLKEQSPLVRGAYLSTYLLENTQQFRRLRLKLLRNFNWTEIIINYLIWLLKITKFWKWLFKIDPIKEQQYWLEYKICFSKNIKLN